jgi:cell wall assembly regulator SMI1
MGTGNLRDQLQRILAHLAGRGYDARPLIFEPPATVAEVRDLESRLKCELPPSFRDVLLTISKHVKFAWFAPKEREYPPPFRSNFCGDLHWSLDLTQKFNENKDEWVREVFPNPEDAYDAVWHNKLAFYEIMNGDYLGIDLSPDTFDQIVYLSHDDGEGHGHVMAESLEGLIDRWVPLACTGGEDWQWLPFTNHRTTLIDPGGANATQWRSLLGLES